VWVGGAAAGSQPRSHGVHFTDIMMHALASPSEDFPRHSIYMQLDGAQAADDQDGSDAVPPEVRLVPAEPSQSEFS
jgi:Regulator of volume decrease after cellular swelling